MAKTPKTFDSTFERYTRGKQIGIGGVGWVFECRTADGRELALKLLRPDVARADRLRRFKNEIAFCLQDRGPNIVRVLDHGAAIIDGVKCPFYVMERYPATLRQLFEEGIEPQRAMSVIEDILAALDVAHAVGAWHRDLKPENVLIDQAGRAVVADFGIAHFAREDLETVVETRAADKLANFKYAAPEQRTRGATVTQQADLYAIGLIAAEAFTGEVIQGAGYRTVSEAAPDYAFLDAVVERLVQQDPSRRPSDARSVQIELSAQRLASKAAKSAQQAASRPVTNFDEVDPPDEIEFAEVLDYLPEHSAVLVRLNRTPPDGFFDWFRSPSNHKSSAGWRPQDVHMQAPDVMVIRAISENQIQQNIDLTREWLRLARKHLFHRRREAAEQKRREDEQRRAEAIRRDQERANVLSSIKL